MDLIRSYGSSADGRFLMLAETSESSAPSAPTGIVVVQNWVVASLQSPTAGIAGNLMPQCWWRSPEHPINGGPPVC